MLVGRLQWVRYAQPDERTHTNTTLYLLFGVLSVLTAVAFIRWGLYLRRKTNGESSVVHRSVSVAPREEISPQDLTRWLNENEEPEADENGQESAE
jgi:hypothetical protein